RASIPDRHSRRRYARVARPTRPSRRAHHSAARRRLARGRAVETARERRHARRRTLGRPHRRGGRVMMSLRASMRALAALLLATGFTASADTGNLPVATYEAHYEVEYKGRKVGVSEFSVSYDSEQERYRF